MDADDLANRVAQSMLAAEGTGPAWGIAIEEAREGYARISMTLTAAMLNGHRIAHGGMVFALADTAFAYVCNGRNYEKRRGPGVDHLPRQRAGRRNTDRRGARRPRLAGRGGVTRVAVRPPDGRAIAEFTGYSRTIGGAVIE